ncbi:inhibitory synaptic factor 2A [Esox lucius]|uniref:Inhibitory synaptic factor 2A n=1 Tax=Esox lucius TaxID=8010 RepID=A0A3P8YDJ9_ESOLU|nr:inhibitory synaptic factor 2A [Esox lucius]XP_019902773.1 inhibitory synaptic factor 2A [Esox lucius]XP_019902774.1 inhibitory synaptic factor 2A [Esox lucius]
MVSKAEGGKCMLTNSESDSEAGPSPSPTASQALEVKYSSLDTSARSQQQVRKRNKALQVRFKDICEAQNEQREAALQAAGKGGKPLAYKVAYRKYMTVPARRSIPNVTKSTGVQTSPDLKGRYKTFPFERKKGHGHTIKHVAAVETYKGHDNGFVIDVKHPKAGEGVGEGHGEGGAATCEGGSGGEVQRTRALLHTTECIATVEQHCPGGPDCSDTLLLTECPSTSNTPGPHRAADYQICSVKSKPRRGLQHRELDSTERTASKRQLLNAEEPGSGRTLPGEGGGASSAPKVTGPIAWNSLTQVECLESPTARGKRKKGLQLNGLQSQTLPRAGAGCTTQAQCHPLPQPLSHLTTEETAGCRTGVKASAVATPGRTNPGAACRQIVPVVTEGGGGDIKAQLQAMENLISSSQETIKVLLGVIQELEKGEAHREGLSYRTGQDTANCDTCRNSACIIYSVELDFKQQEDKLQPLMKKLCPQDDSHFSSLPYPHEAFTSTPKRKAKADSKKHARWKLWFL